MAFSFHFLRKLNSTFAFGIFSLKLFFGLVCLRFCIHFIQSFLFFLDVNIVVFIGFLNAVISEELQHYHVVFFNSFSYPESVAMEAVHAQKFEQNVNNQRIIGWYDQLNMTWMARTLKSFMAAGGANRIPLVGGHSE